MLKLLMRFLSPDTQALIQLAWRMVDRLDTPEERRAVAEYGLKMLSPDSSGGSRCTVSEWAVFGSKLGILRGKKRMSNDWKITSTDIP